MCVPKEFSLYENPSADYILEQLQKGTSICTVISYFSLKVIIGITVNLCLASFTLRLTVCKFSDLLYIFASSVYVYGNWHNYFYFVHCLILFSVLFYCFFCITFWKICGSVQESLLSV